MLDFETNKACAETGTQYKSNIFLHVLYICFYKSYISYY